MPIEELPRRSGGRMRNVFSDAIGAYNDLRDHPTDGARLLKLAEMYESLHEAGEAESAARHFPDAMAAEPRCAEVLGRIRTSSGLITPPANR